MAFTFSKECEKYIHDVKGCKMINQSIKQKFVYILYLCVLCIFIMYIYRNTCMYILRENMIDYK